MREDEVSAGNTGDNAEEGQFSVEDVEARRLEELREQLTKECEALLEKEHIELPYKEDGARTNLQVEELCRLLDIPATSDLRYKQRILDKLQVDGRVARRVKVLGVEEKAPSDGRLEKKRGVVIDDSEMTRRGAEYVVLAPDQPDPTKRQRVVALDLRDEDNIRFKDKPMTSRHLQQYKEAIAVVTSGK
jgi:hypothetical protein